MEKQTILDMCEYLEIREDMQEVLVCYLRKELQNFFFIDTNLYADLDQPHLFYQISCEEKLYKQEMIKAILIEPTKMLNPLNENCLKIEIASYHHLPILFFQKFADSYYRVDELNLTKEKPYIQTEIYDAEAIYDNILLAKIKNLSTFSLTNHLCPFTWIYSPIKVNEESRMLRKHFSKLNQKY